MKWPRLFSGIRPAPTVKMTAPELARALGVGSQSRSGTTVTWSTSLEVSTVLACARVIGEGLAQVPFRLHRRQGARQEVALDHPLNDLIAKKPNETNTSFEMRETLGLHLLLTNNAFVWLGRVGSDRHIAALDVLEPGRECTVRRDYGRLIYSGTRDGVYREYDPGEIWHIRGPSWNSWLGLDTVRMLREAIGLAQATEKAHATLHGGGTRNSGTYTVKGTLSPEKFQFLAEWLKLYEEGGERAGETLLLDNDAKFESTQMNGVDAEHLATRRFQVEEICRGCRVMPMMVGLTDKTATYASVEQMLIAHVVHTMMPWYGRLEQSADCNLLTERERAAGFYTKFNANALMRGDSAARGKFYSMALGAGGTPAWMTQDEVRGLEEMDPRGGDADELSAGAMNKPAGGGSPDAGAEGA